MAAAAALIALGNGNAEAFSTWEARQPATEQRRSSATPAPWESEPEEVFALPVPLDDEAALELLRHQDVAPLLPQQPLTPFDSRSSATARILQPQERLLNSYFGRRYRTRNLTKIPNMIGDTSAGGCGSVEFLPGISGNIEHPTFNCVRLNVAETNSPIPRDRVYMRYNHFHNITTVSVFPGAFEDGTSDLHIDRITLGGEKSFFDGALSIEVRIPFSRELTSNVVLENIKEVTNFPIDDYDTEFGNVSILTKFLLLETDRSVLSCGLALNTPTADDVRIRARVDDDQFPFTIPNGPTLFFVDVDGDATATVNNEIFNLSPFVGFVVAPDPQTFVHGFVQLDLPLNDADISFAGRLDINGREETFSDSGKYKQQDLLRINLGAGHWLLQNPQARHLTGVAATAELHYTTTLQNAELYRAGFPIPLFPIGPPLPGELTAGNLANRVDILNLTLGGIFELWEHTTLAHGFVVPLRTTGASRPFDFEYTLQLDRRF